MKQQKKLIQDRDWDTLIVLDDCRYDYFESIYDDYLSGELKPIESASFQTQNWIDEVFIGQDFRDTVYISGNPHINSQGLGAFGYDPLYADRYFYEVVDVWDFGWDNILRVTPPEPVTESALLSVKKFDKKLIVHFLQPHEPYIPLIKSTDEGNENGNTWNKILTATIREFKIKEELGQVFKSIVPHQVLYIIRRLLGLSPRLPREIVKCYGVKTLRKAYLGNLKIVLEEVSRLVSNLNDDKKIIITADHGEALGEDGELGHKQMAVPWMKVDSND